MSYEEETMEHPKQKLGFYSAYGKNAEGKRAFILSPEKGSRKPLAFASHEEAKKAGWSKAL